MATAKRLALALVVAATVLGAVVGCASQRDEPPEPREPPEPVVSVTARTPSPSPTATEVTGVARDVTVLRCDLKAGQAVASGSVVNTAMRPADFAITITWLPDKASEPVAVGSTTVPAVERGATVPWTITTTLPNRAGHCTVHARRGELS